MVEARPVRRLVQAQALVQAVAPVEYSEIASNSMRCQCILNV